MLPKARYRPGRYIQFVVAFVSHSLDICFAHIIRYLKKPFKWSAVLKEKFSSLIDFSMTFT